MSNERMTDTRSPLRVAFDHLDIAAMRVSHGNDVRRIESALAAEEAARLRGEAAPQSIAPPALYQHEDGRYALALGDVARRRLTDSHPGWNRVPLDVIEMDALRGEAARAPSYEALQIITQSVCGALDRAGVTDCDDPGEAIDVMRERYEARIAEMTAQGELQAVASPANCRNRLMAEGKPYPKSGCKHCKTGGLTGCPYERKVHDLHPQPVAVAGDAVRISEVLKSMRRLALVVREHGTCAPLAVDNIADRLEAALSAALAAPALRAGDARQFNGTWMVCTDPDMERFVSFDGQDTPAPVAGGAVAKLPDYWRGRSSAIGGTGESVHADELEAALAQDRASQGAAAGVPNGLTLGQRAVAAELLRCFTSWQRGVRVLGDVQAGDAADLMAAMLAAAPQPEAQEVRNG